MSAGLRDERVKLYTYSDVGTGGRASPKYTLSATVWGRKATPSSREATIAGQASQSVDAVFVLPERVTVPGDGAIRDQNGSLFKIVGVMPVRSVASLKEQIVYAVSADEQSMTAAES